MWKRSAVPGTVAIVLLTLVAMGPALSGGFIWDDDAYVTGNETLRSPGGLRRIWLEPGAVPQYYPLVHTTFWLESRLWGMDPVGYHAVNVVLHATAALLAWAALRRLRLPGAWFAAALFAVHPVHVESVAWITERKNVLSAVFYLSTLLALLRAEAIDDRGPPERYSGRAYFAAYFLLLAAVLSKSVTATLPAAFLLILWWRRGRICRRAVLLCIPLFLLGVGFGLLTLWMEKHRVGAQGPEWSLTFLQRWLLAGRAVWFYAGKLILPRDLSFFYPRWRLDAGSLQQYLFPASFLLATATLWLMRKRIGRGPLAAVLFFVGTLFPALGFFNVYPMRYSYVNDHYQYLASLGLIALFAGIAATGMERGRGGVPGERRSGGGARGTSGRTVTRRFLGPIAALLLLAVLTGAARQRCAVFRDPEALWEDTIAKNPDCWMAQHNLAMVFEGEGRTQEAIELYRRALGIRPDLPQTRFNLGRVLAGRQQWEEARAMFETAVRLEPGYADGHVSLGNVIYRQGDAAAALAHYREALRIDPGNFAAHRNTALILMEGHDYAGAAVHWRAALRAHPEDLDVAERLAWLLATAPDREVRDGAEAVRLAQGLCRSMGGGSATARAALAAAYAEMGRFDQAVPAMRAAIHLAETAGDGEAASRLRAQLELFEIGNPLRID